MAAPLGPIDGMVCADVMCRSCGYNLRTQCFAGRCPECGTAVEQSIVVLPQRDATAAAFRLASWALLIGLLLILCQASVVGSIILWVAARRLYLRCELQHMPELYRRTRWFYWTMSASMVLSLLTVAMKLLGLFTTLVQIATPALMTTHTATNGTVTVTHSALDVPLALVPDGTGGFAVTVADATGSVVSTVPLTVQAPALITTAGGDTATITLGPGARLTVLPPSGAPAQIGFGGPGQRMQRTTGALSALSSGGTSCLTMLDHVISLLAACLYLIVARALAMRIRDPALARHFRIIMVFLLGGLTSLALAGILMVLLISGGVVTPIIVNIALGILAMLALVVAAIWQIVASFTLTRKLDRVFTAWSEVVAPAP